jgi:hypothetical protein
MMKEVHTDELPEGITIKAGDFIIIGTGNLKGSN